MRCHPTDMIVTSFAVVAVTFNTMMPPISLLSLSVTTFSFAFISLANYVPFVWSLPCLQFPWVPISRSQFLVMIALCNQQSDQAWNSPNLVRADGHSSNFRHLFHLLTTLRNDGGYHWDAMRGDVGKDMMVVARTSSSSFSSRFACNWICLLCVNYLCYYVHLFLQHG